MDILHYSASNMHDEVRASSRGKKGAISGSLGIDGGFY